MHRTLCCLQNTLSGCIYGCVHNANAELVLFSGSPFECTGAGSRNFNMSIDRKFIKFSRKSCCIVAILLRPFQVHDLPCKSAQTGHCSITMESPRLILDLDRITSGSKMSAVVISRRCYGNMYCWHGDFVSSVRADFGIVTLCWISNQLKNQKIYLLK